jgi:hypothetical protein
LTRQGRRSHQKQTQRKHSLATDSVAEMSKEYSHDGPNQISRCKNAEYFELCKPLGRVRREEHTRKQFGENTATMKS